MKAEKKQASSHVIAVWQLCHTLYSSHKRMSKCQLFIFTRAVGAGPAGAAAAGPKFGTPTKKNDARRAQQARSRLLIRTINSRRTVERRYGRVALHCRAVSTDESVLISPGLR